MVSAKNNGWLKQHLLDRRVDLSHYTAWFEEETVKFPLWNLSGQLVGYQQYRPFASKEPNNNPKLGRYFTSLSRERVGVWGLESWTLSQTLFVCEGLFDASAVTWAGFSAVAVFGNECSNSLASWFWVVRKQRPVVALLDNDSAGSALSKYAHQSYRSPLYKDPGEYPDSYLRLVCNSFN